MPTPERATVKAVRDSDEYVAESALLKQLDPRLAAKLTPLGIRATYRPDEFVFRQGDQSGLFYFIVSGSVALETPGASRTTRIQTLHEGDFLGWSALLGSGTRHFQARVLTRVTVLAFDGVLVLKTCEADTQFGYALMKRLLLLVTERLDATRMQLASIY